MSEEKASTIAKGRKERVGEVVSTKMNKTIVVCVTRRIPHPRFKKLIKQSKHYYAHDDEGKASVGDKVRIVEVPPMSKLKRWALAEVIKH